MNNSILLFIPVFNCNKQIVRLIKKLEGENLDLIDEILIIDNRSTDNTVDEIKTLLANIKMNIRIKLIQNDYNYHLGGSHKIAFNYALENDYCGLIIMHGDDQTELNYLTHILNDKKNYLGARFLKDSILPCWQNKNFRETSYLIFFFQLS